MINNMCQEDTPIHGFYSKLHHCGTEKNVGSFYLAIWHESVIKKIVATK